MRKLVFLFKGDRGLYTKIKGRRYFPSRRCFPNAREGFAFVEVCEEQEKYGLLSGEMAAKGTFNIEDCFEELHRVGGEWVETRVCGYEVAVSYDGYALRVYLDGEVYSDWGYTESELYSRLTAEDVVRRPIYLRGYVLGSMVDRTDEGVTLEEARKVVCWAFGRNDRLYTFCEGKVAMFDPMSGCMGNRGVLVGTNWEYLDDIETIYMWDYLSGKFSDKRELVF